MVSQGYFYNKILHDFARFCQIVKDFARFMKGSKRFCKIYDKFEEFLPTSFFSNYQRLKQTLLILRYGVKKLNYQRLKLPISRYTCTHSLRFMLVLYALKAIAVHDTLMRKPYCLLSLMKKSI